MSSESLVGSAEQDTVVISVNDLAKCFQIYSKPSHRLLQAFLGNGRKLYQEFWALRGISFEVKRGETLGIIGRNGSGKSTLLQMIAGTLAPTLGNVKVHGRVAALLELGSGFNPEFTGRENIRLNGTILGLSAAEIDARMDAIIGFSEIGTFIDQPVKNYSSGMVMRLAFSVMAHVDAEVLIIDEALAVGDAFFTQKCMRFLREFKQKGTLLFVSHDSGAVTGLCDRAIWLDQGVMRSSGSAKKVVNDYLEAFLKDQHGGGSVGGSKRASQEEVPARAPRDIRQDLMDRSTLRNDIRVFPFDPDSAGFGDGLASVVEVVLLDEAGRQLANIKGGELVELNVLAKVSGDLQRPIVGFYLRDRLGQLLFGDNTYLSYFDQDMSIVSNEMIQAKFKFMMPRLASGDYYFTVGVADGTQEKHFIQHWIHEALHIHSDGQGMPAGIIGLPLESVVLEKVGVR